VYYGLFSYFIRRFDLKTLGREAEDGAPQAEDVNASAPVHAWIKALGDADNLRAVEACTTRLRLVLADVSRIDEPALKALGSRGVLRIGDGAVQVVVGPVADQLASEIRAGLRSGAAPPAVSASVAPVTRSAVTDPNALAAALAALGGRKNIAQVHLGSSRLCVAVRDPAAVDENALAKSVRALARPAPGSLHLVLGPAADAWYAELKDS
jgi:PTS system N-acetylglucosamine-specific IIC component